MRDVFIVSAARTPVGRFGGRLAEVSARELGVVAVGAALDRAGLAPGQVDEVIMGNARQAGIGPNIARQIAHFAGIPVDKNAFTVNKACGSGLKSVLLGFQAIAIGDAEVVVAGGTESMSQVPYLLPRARWGYRLGNGELVDAMYQDGFRCQLCGLVMGETAEILAERYGITREEQDTYALESQRKAGAAIRHGHFEPEIVAVAVPAKGGPQLVKDDEHPRPDVTLEQLAALPPAFKIGGTVTAGNSSGLNDAAAAVALASGEKVREAGLSPMARIVSYAASGVDPSIMGIAPVGAIDKAIRRAGLSLQDINLLEINEAFAAQMLALEREVGWDRRRLNVNGGAIALGHPVGASGARILVTLLYELKRRGARYGLAGLCISGGQGLAVVVENLVR